MWCKVDTKNGGFGITSSHHEGSLASTNMALADIDTLKADPQFIELLFRNKWFYKIINSKSKGTTNRKYLKPKEVCDLIEIPNLTLQEQLDFVKLYDNIAHSGLKSEVENQKILVGKLRQAILQEAIQGKLTTQWRKANSSVEDASELLKRIEAEKQQLIADKKIKKEKPLPPIEEEDIPFELPAGWVWSNILQISLKVTDGEHATPLRAESGYKLLSARNVTNEGIRLHKVDYVGEDEFKRIRKRCDPQKGDILISCSGSVGRVCLVDKDDEYCMVRSAALVKQHHDNIIGNYLVYSLRSPLLQKQIIEKSRTSAQSNLFLGKIKELVFPLPPLEEQQTIVEKVFEEPGKADNLSEDPYGESSPENVLKYLQSSSIDSNAI